MEMTNDSCKDCRAHSGIYTGIKHLEKTNGAQWAEIDGMKKLLIGTLITSGISMVGIIFMLLIQLARATGKAP